jgi:hypothetical protein
VLPLAVALGLLAGCSDRPLPTRDSHLPSEWTTARVDPEKGGRFLPERNEDLRRFQVAVLGAGAPIPYPHYGDSGTITVVLQSDFVHTARRLRILLENEASDPGLSVLVIADEPPEVARRRLALDDTRASARVSLVQGIPRYASHASFPMIRDYAPLVRVRATASGMQTEGLVLFRGSTLNKMVDTRLGIRIERDPKTLRDRYRMTESLADLYTDRIGRPLAIHHLELLMDGGDLVTDGRGSCFFTKGFLHKNRRGRSFIERELREKVGCSRAVFLAAPQRLDFLQHVDTLLYFVDPENVILSMPTLYESDLIHEFQNMRELLSLGYRVHRVPRKTASITYTNILTTRYNVYVPQYSVFAIESEEQLRIDRRVTELDRERDRDLIAYHLRHPVKLRAVPADEEVREDNDRALEIVQRLFPGKRVVGVNSDETVRTMGSWHCASHELPETL